MKRGYGLLGLCAICMVASFFYIRVADSPSEYRSLSDVPKVGKYFSDIGAQEIVARPNRHGQMTISAVTTVSEFRKIAQKPRIQCLFYIAAIATDAEGFPTSFDVSPDLQVMSAIGPLGPGERADYLYAFFAPSDSDQDSGRLLIHVH